MIIHNHMIIYHQFINVCQNAMRGLFYFILFFYPKMRSIFASLILH